VLDYCALGSNRRLADKRILAVAAETKKVTELVHVLGHAGFSAELVEPAMVSYLRAIGAKKIMGKSSCNVLVAILRESSLILCVLRNGVIDFVRIKETGRNSAASDDICGWLAEELSEIQQFYSVEFVDNPGKWEVTVFADTGRLPQDAEERLKSKIQAGSLQVRTSKDAYLDTPINVPAAGQNSEQPSSVAVGLAMNLLMAQRDDIRLNLMPPQIVQTKEAQTDALIAVNVVAALLLLMVLAVGGPAYMAERISRIAAAKEALVTGQNTEAMIERNLQLDTRLQALSSRLDSIAQISASHNDVNWAQLLKNIRKATPIEVRINGLYCGDGARMQIEGLAMSNEAINSFVSALEKSPDIASVTLLDTSKQDTQKGFVTYIISCKLGIRSAKADNVS
jgi:Tfp pilus assembly protein PilN